jgi:predicted ATPase
VRLDKLEALLSQGRSDRGEALPLIAELLTIPMDGRCKPLDLSPQRRKQRTLATLIAQVEGLAADQPVLMLFEDAHWSDPTSLELMDLLIERVPPYLCWWSRLFGRSSCRRGSAGRTSPRSV